MFRFKRFSIEQDRTPMKVGTDGVLLGAWVGIEECDRRILDIGTGTGVIALMMAQRSGAEVDGVEIDGASAAQAAENVARSEWGERVVIHHTEIQNYHPTNGGYDIVVTNPPYFINSLTCPDSSRTTARHTIDLTFRDLVLSVVRLLNPAGRFALILPAQEARLFDSEALGRLTLTRRCEVYSRENTPVKRVMSEYQLPPVMREPRHETITIERGDPPTFSAEYRELTRDFYLKF